MFSSLESILKQFSHSFSEAPGISRLIYFNAVINKAANMQEVVIVNLSRQVQRFYLSALSVYRFRSTRQSYLSCYHCSLYSMSYVCVVKTVYTLYNLYRSRMLFGYEYYNLENEIEFIYFVIYLKHFLYKYVTMANGIRYLYQSSSHITKNCLLAYKTF